ncbi:hypothetical protein M413DRAFT_253727 [Hebeloma cylindrosporum]|uniref:Uncharacterized protein n=1 Tax=Hebeloma cylindrosporum TaxID=76867 RepID=A0A0C3C094_HEBCY|nr:hypothetical protein M413DRAFT_253727 [Hebeloma cylindrosporum h7]
MYRPTCPEHGETFLSRYCRLSQPRLQRPLDLTCLKRTLSMMWIMGRTSLSVECDPRSIIMYMGVVHRVFSVHCGEGTISISGYEPGVYGVRCGVLDRESLVSYWVMLIYSGFIHRGITSIPFMTSALHLGSPNYHETKF